MMSDVTNRGRAYKCKRCSAILRKGRMQGHVLKYHVPMDQVPFSCTLCRFGCQDRQTLLDHITNYKRHVDAEAKLTTIPNYAEMLKKADHPYVVGDADMVMLSREESQQWWRSRRQPSFTEEDPFQDEEEDEGVTMRGGRMFPSWALTDNTGDGKVPTYEPTPISQMSHGSRRVASQTTVEPSGLAYPRQGILEQAMQSLGAAPLMSMPSLTAQPLQLCRASKQPTHSILNTPAILQRSPSVPVTTPCLDENILPALLGPDTEDPLYKETCTRDEASRDATPSEHQEGPVKKKARVDSNNNSTSPDHSQFHDALTEISKAISSGFQKVVEALDANTRAIRCQDKTLDKAVAELSRIERKMTQIERSLQQPRATHDKPPTSPGVVHQKPAMKSVVKRV